MTLFDKMNNIDEASIQLIRKKRRASNRCGTRPRPGSSAGQAQAINLCLSRPKVVTSTRADMREQPLREQA